jgi:hypothetical protein
MTFGAAGHSGHAPSDDKFFQPQLFAVGRDTKNKPTSPTPTKMGEHSSARIGSGIPADSGRLAAGRRVGRQTRDTFTGDNSFRSFERVTMARFFPLNFDLFFVNHRFNGFLATRAVQCGK